VITIALDLTDHRGLMDYKQPLPDIYPVPYLSGSALFWGM